MKLKVLLVDDEPGALRFLAHMVEARCAGWEVAGTAENGRQALRLMEETRPDMVLTDIRMPVMDGILLAEQVKGRWPGVRTAVISGYEDFSAAQNAIRHGVSDYLLKPVDPARLVDTMQQARAGLLEQRRAAAARLMTAAVGGERVDSTEAARLFPGDRFQAALIRSGSLPTQYVIRLSPRLQVLEEARTGPLPEGCWALAGRDDCELFVFQLRGEGLCPLEKGVRRLRGLLGGEHHITAWRRVDFPLAQAGDAAMELMRLVDRGLVPGMNRELDACAPQGRQPEPAMPWSSGLEQKVVGMCTGLCRTKELQELYNQLFSRWREEQRPLYYVRRDLVRLLSAVERGVASRRYRPADDGQQLEEAMLLSRDYAELQSRVWQLVLDILSRAEHQQAPPGSEAFFEEVREYMERNLSEQLSLPVLCAAMGISQTYMSRIFRKNTNLSFGEYLTRRRIQRAKSILEENRELPLKTVAELVGYKDPLYFSKVFRSVEGVPPSRYLESRDGALCKSAKG